MSTDQFFQEAKEQSEVKTAIVTKYFLAWAKVIIPWAKKKAGKVAFIDLFAGPGRYEDGTTSTPLLVLERAIKDNDLRSMLVSIFNDVNEDHSRALEAAIAQLPGVDSLKYEPKVYNDEVGSSVVEHFESMTLVPTFFFIDPWGYKGLSLRLVNAVLKDWGCDCIFFFNYNRINMGIRNPLVVEHMDALFGKERAEALRKKLEGLPARERELTVVETLCDALKEMGGKYLLPFRFRHPTQGRTSHHLIFVSKHVRGYEIMKEIMAKESSSSNEGVASFEYNPALHKQGLLFELSQPLTKLGQRLLKHFAGRNLTMKEVYEQHHVDRPFIKKNYKEVLAQLEADGKVEVDPPAEDRLKRKGKATFADTVTVTFPRRR